MILKKKALVLALLTVYLESGTALASSPLTQQLKEQAQFWAQRGKEDNAADAWRKLLQVEPSNVDALMALVLHEAKTGNPEQAKSYFSKLKGSQASSAQIRSVEDALRRGTAGGSGQLDEARKLARQGDSESAIEAYKQIGDPSRLKGEAAFEYLQTLAGTKNGYPDAKRGLEKLSKDNPSNTRYALAYAQVLTYREPSRLEGIAALENLSSKADVGKQAADSWRQALSWMGLKNENAKHFRRYLDKFPDDQVISERLASLNRPAAPSALEEKPGPVKVIATAKQNVAVKPPAEVKQKAEAAPKKDNTAKAESSAKVSAGNLDKARTAAFKSLDDNDVKTAEAGFQALIKSHPKDSAGYGGMGLVKMREEEFIEARGFLEKAVEYSPAQSKDQWKKAFEDASYWAIVAEARTAFEDGDSVKGIAFLRKAIALNGTEPAGILQLADALQAENDLKGAEENYRHVLNADKTNLRALDGVIGVLVLQKRLADLEALSSIMLPRHLAIVANLKSEELWNKAKAAEAAGDLNTAQSTLEDAILIKPDNAWLRMALSKIYLKRDMPGQARALIEAMTNVENPDPEALYVSALLSEMQQQWWDAMITLERIPPASRKKEMAEMQRRLWIRVQLDRIELLRKRGNLVAAKNILTTVESVTANDPEFTSAMANLYIQLGDTERGYAMIRQAVQNTPKPSAGLLLQYAGTLMQPNQEGELEAAMLRVAAMPKLEEAEITAFQQLQRILSIRYAERAREAGDYATAYNYIQPLLIANPDDSMLLLALARLYNTSGDKESARELYGKVLETEPENPEVLQGLVYAAIEAKDFENAERHLDLLMRLQPDNPRYIALAGNVARAQGNNSRALSYFKQALAMEQSQRPSALMGPNGIRLVAQGQAPNINDFRVNPFSDRNQASAGGSNGVALRNAPVQQQASVPNSKSAIFAPVGIPLQQPAQNARSAQGQYSIPQLPASITQNYQVNSAGTAVQARPQPSVPQLPASVTAPAPISAPAPASMAVSNGAPAILQGGSSGTPGGTTVGAATIYQIPPAVVTRSPLTQSPVGNSNVYSGEAPASAASPSPSYVAPKASYSNSYASPAPAPVPQQYAAATGNSGTGSKARATKPVTNVSAEEAGLLKEIDAI
ncbi:tetratricopeptide repeat protein, partial [Undibacterium sp. TJN19]|uniref:tetratricopeptide repeat protein n=1 Tax=Undibacterium sp. TJN19 TaxID=3413055 RepID=UPI003BEFCD0D